MSAAERGAVDLGPSHLQVDRRSRGVESRYRATADAFLLKRPGIVTNSNAGAGGADGSRQRHGAGGRQVEGWERRLRRRRWVAGTSWPGPDVRRGHASREG